MPKQVAYMTDPQCREALLTLIDRINNFALLSYTGCSDTPDYEIIHDFWTECLEYEHNEILEY